LSAIQTHISTGGFPQLGPVFAWQQAPPAGMDEQTPPEHVPPQHSVPETHVMPSALQVAQRPALQDRPMQQSAFVAQNWPWGMQVEHRPSLIAFVFSASPKRRRLARAPDVLGSVHAPP
jgi:hypothetical protein